MCSSFGVFSSLPHGVKGLPDIRSSETFEFLSLQTLVPLETNVLLPPTDSVLSHFSTSGYLQQEVGRVGFLCTLTRKEECISPV